MARGKKKETLTPEERLQAALVPENEQPYKVPENWCWMRGRAFLKPMETKRPEGEVFRYIDIDSIDNKRQQVTEPKNLQVKDAPSRASRKLRTGDTVFSMVRPYLMNIAYIDETISNSIASTGFYVCTPAENVNSLYLYYLMTSPYTVDGLNRYMKGDNSPSIRKDDIENYAYPIPSLPEQQRIVDRIEGLFAKLDEAKQKTQDALDSFETRKAAILHKAFTGELTAQWRREHSVGIESWEERTIVDLCSMIIDCPHSTPEWSDKGKICLRTTNIKDGYLDLSDVRYVTDDIFDQRNRRAVPQAGDVLLTREGNIGDVGVIPENVEICLGQRMMLLRPNKCQSAFLIYFFRNPKILTDIKAGTMGSTAPRMNIKDIKQLKIHCPNDKEQAEIVRILDDLLAKEQQAKEVAEGVLEQIDLIKKSVLARAFRGELGTNDPSEESAVELLKVIM